MATRKRKKSTVRRKSTVTRSTVQKTKKRSVRSKKDWLDKLLDF